MRARTCLAALVGAALALAAGCSAGEAETFRVGILADCFGPFSSLHETVVASAELPLIERGARLTGTNPSDGLEGGRVAGRPVELLSGCVAGNEDVIPEARRLVEEEGADVLVGPLYAEEGMVLRDYARRRPETTFLIQSSPAPELTLSDPAPNVFRFFPDSAQFSAGLGTYAYRRLGWRTAATVGDNVPYGWGAISGFVAEFCALGGKVTKREWAAPYTLDPARLVPKLKGPDGVFLGTALQLTRKFLVRYSKLHRDVPRRLIATGNLLTDPSVLPLAQGVVLGGQFPDKPTPAVAHYLPKLTKAFPKIPVPLALQPLAIAYRDGVEAALEGLEKTDGRAGAALQRALVHVQLDSPEGPIRLDSHRQAIAPNYLSRVVLTPDGKPEIEAVRVVPNVEQTFGGYFTPHSPPRTRTTPACRKATPPPWAR